MYVQTPILTQWLDFPRSAASRILDKSQCRVGQHYTCTHTTHCTRIAGLIPQSIPLQAQRTCADITSWKSARRRICLCVSTGCIKMIGAVLKLSIFTSMVNKIINTSRNERVTQQDYDTYLQMFDVCTLRHKAHIETIVQFLPHSAQQVKCDGLHSRGNSVLQIR